MQLCENRVLERGSRVRVESEELAAAKSVLGRAALLPPRDRLLVELALRRVTHRRIGELMKLPPGTVTRRIHRLSKRLHDPVVIALLDERCPLEPDIRQLGVERLLVGMTDKELAAKHELRRGEVRKRLEYISGWYRGLRHARGVAPTPQGGR
jgi:hypothetical protein